MKKRAFSFLLVLCMLFSMIPVSASALETDGTNESTVAQSARSAATSFYDLYVTDGLVAFYDAFDPQSDVLDLKNGKWYAKVYNAANGTFEKTANSAYTATIVGDWSKEEKGFSYYADSMLGNKISFPVSLISSLENYSAEFVGRVDLREVHDAPQESGTVTKVTADGKTTYVISDLTLLTYNGGNSYCTNCAFYTVTLKGEANETVDLVINDKDVSITLDGNGDYVYMAACEAKLDTYTIVAPSSVALTFSKDKKLNSECISYASFVFGSLYATTWTNKIGNNVWGNGEGLCRWYVASADWSVHNGSLSNSAYGGAYKDCTTFKNQSGKVATMNVDKTELAAGESYAITLGHFSGILNGNRKFADQKLDLLSDTCGAALAFRLYNRHLTAEEKALNAFVDKMLYNDVDFAAYDKLNEEEKEAFQNTVADLDIVAGEAAYADALASFLGGEVQENESRVMSDYDKLYVGADGSKTENGGGLIALYSAYKGNTDSVNLANQVWRNKVTKNDAIIAGALYEEATGNGYWRMREDGGLGYDLSVKYTSGLSTTSRYNNASGVNLTLDPSLLSSPDFAVEYVVKYEYLDLDNGSGVIGKYTGTASTNYFSNCNPTTIIGLFKDFAVRGGAYDSIHRGIRWYITDGVAGWGSGDNTYNSATWGDASRATDDVIVQTISRDETAEADGSYSAVYTVYKDGVTSVSGKYSSTETRGAYKYHHGVTGSFQLFRQMPVSVYAIRVYDAELTVAEMAHNRLIDLAAYCGADLTAYLALAQGDRAIIDSVMAGASFTSDKATFSKKLDDIVSAFENVFDMDSILYVTDGLEVLLMAYKSMNSGTLVTGERSVSWFNAVKRGSFASLRGTGWEFLPDGGFQIVKTCDQFVADKTFGLYLDKEMLPEGDYTVELVANPVGITNEDGNRYYGSGGGLRVENGFAIGPLRAYQFVCYNSTELVERLEKRWIYESAENAWAASGEKAMFADTSWHNLSLDQILTYSVSLDLEEKNARYRFAQDGTYIGSFKIDADEYISNEEAGNKFQLMVGVAGTVFACRVYNRVLTPAEMRHNRFIDLALYCDADLSAYAELTNEKRALVDAALASRLFSTDKAEFEDALATAIASASALDEMLNGSCGAESADLVWQLDISTGVLEIVGEGAMASYSSASPAPWHAYRSLIKTVKIGENVTEIGAYAFYDCMGIAFVEIPSGVRKIGACAFSSCTALVEISFAENSRVAEIGDDAFASCVTLERVNVMDVSAWCRISFYDQMANPLYYADGLYVDGNHLSVLKIPEGTEAIGNYAFFRYKGLTKVEIPATVTHVGWYAFAECTGLEKVTFGTNSELTNIDVCAFNNCSSLAEVVVPSSVTDIRAFAFANCESLTSVTIPSSVTTIEENAFINCRLLSTVYLYSSDIISILDSSDGVYTYLIAYARSIVIPVFITDIPASVTEGNRSYTENICCNGVVCAVYATHVHVWETYTDGSFAGEKCSVCSVVAECINATVVTSKGANINVSSDITLKYYVEVVKGCENVYAVFTFGDSEYIVRDYTVDAKGRYVFAFTGITPQCLGDEIHFAVYATYNGVEFSAVKESYSIKEYCANLLKKYPDDRKLVIMISDLLTYGAKAQIYKNYKTDALVTEGLALTPSSTVTLDASYNQKALVGTADESVKWKSVGLRYENTMVMYFRFYAEDVTGLSVKITINGRTSVYTAADFTDEGNGYYRVDFRGIAATEFNDTVSASFEREGVAVGQTAIYSVNSYVYLYQNSADAALADLLKATYLYGDAADLYTDPSRWVTGEDISQTDKNWELE